MKAGALLLALAGMACAGSYDVTGRHPERGPYGGVAVVEGTAVARLVDFLEPLPDGRRLAVAWHGRARATPDGLSVRFPLRRGHLIARAGGLVRAPHERGPVDEVIALARVAGGALESDGERWTPTARRAPAIPALSERWVDWPDGVPDGWLDGGLDAFFATFQLLPDVAADAAPRARYRVLVDRTGRELLGQRGPGTVLLVDKVIDAIAIAEETPRSDALGLSPHEKARRFDAAMRAFHVDASGFICGVWTVPPHRPDISGDGALHQGIWVAAQAYRWRLTRSAEALENVERGLDALAKLVEIVPDPSTFARAVADLRHAPSRFVRGTGAHAQLAWLPGGNNDMLHGIEYGFLAALPVLPADHPLRARIAGATRSLLDHCAIARRGTHDVILSCVLARVTGDPADRRRFERATAKNEIHRRWVAGGNGLMHTRGITDWSGHHLAATTFLCLRLFDNRGSDGERAWRRAGEEGVRAGWARMAVTRETLLALLASELGQPGARRQALELLDEFPCPKPAAHPGAPVVYDRRVDPASRLSPLPTLPWKLDWVRNEGRRQLTTSAPLFHRAIGDNAFASNPFSPGNALPPVREPGQDYLHAYWFARLSGLLTAP